MVKVKDVSYYAADGSIDLGAWLERLESIHHYGGSELIRSACMLSQLAGGEQVTESGESCLQQGLAMAEILADLDVDPETLAAAIIYDSVQYAELSIEDVEQHLGTQVAKLVNCVERMGAINTMRGMSKRSSRQQKDNIRKMLLAMVDDVRGVLIKLAERLRVLRTVSQLGDGIRIPIAKETMDIYAPLANRLGIGAIKWEMEDLSFRYLQAEKYKEIAKGLKSRRVDRDKYVVMVVNALEAAIEHIGLKGADVYGRSKHIHSIYRKMHRKNVPLSEIFDATALRVLVEKDEDCYTVMTLVHELWRQIPEEFDDYVSNPKSNGYRSLHTAVIGPEGKNFEVQIRTHQMHSEAELGVAAHWKYKEGSALVRESHERKIEWLREVLAWQRDMSDSGDPSCALETEFLDDRVYVFTPEGDVLDLPVGATPLDFAYAVHSEVGHRCRGAKVDGRIVQLIHQLETGEQVEILRGNEAKPSRDWLNPHLNYLNSSRSKAKVHHWFKQQDFEKNREDGQILLDRELQRLELKAEKLKKIALELNFKKKDDLLAALGRGDLRLAQVINKLSPESAQVITPKVVTHKFTTSVPTEVKIAGVGNLLTQIAKCCKPVPGDEIIGYITLGRGVSIHRKDCPNILSANEAKKERFLEVSWGEQAQELYKADVKISAFDRQHLLRDVTLLLSNEKASVFSLTTHTDKNDNMATLFITVEVNGVEGLSRLLAKLKQLPNVIEAKRVV